MSLPHEIRFPVPVPLPPATLAPTLRFVADLHIHSHLSRATSKDLDLEHLHRWAQLKGITVVGTGDFTHPGWMAELRDKLVPAESGLYALRPDLAAAVDAEVPPACRAPVRFLLSVEVSSIYKRGERVRKVHNLVYVPDLPAADRVAAALGRLGNIASDGRPILGVDARDLLEITLGSSPDAFLIPAHIWTPWFSALGAQSGFDSIAECFRDLAGHIFAAETGLSSDPAMNWRVSALDRYALVSSSDAHSLEKLGREASLFDCDLSYQALRDSLRDRREQFLGTIEFFPEEGKYHFDGHRKCEVVLAPAEAAAAGHLCPRCGKRLTGGVMSRVDALADRQNGFRPAGAKPFHSLVPLRELLGEVVDAGPGSGRVQKAYERLLARVGPELAILTAAPCEDVAREAPPLLDEALRRMRRGQVAARAGYDGEYGVVRVFDEDERRRLLAQTCFGFSFAGRAADAPLPAPAAVAAPVARPRAAADALDAAQRQVIEHGEGPLLVVAGPGTGKTRTVVERIARLVRGHAVSPRAITAITFTRKAAGELRERLAASLGGEGARVSALTFHAFGLDLLRAFPAAAGLPEGFAVLDDEARQPLVRAAAAESGFPSVARAAAALSWSKAVVDIEPPLASLHAAYERALAAAGAVDQDDLVLRAVSLLEACPEALAHARERCRHLFVDEYQDVNAAQDRLVRLLVPPGGNMDVCVVGDPDQAIYGFRGADPAHFARFARDYQAEAVTLSRNFRSPGAVVAAASAVIARSPGRRPRPLEAEGEAGPAVERLCAADDLGEGEAIAAEIERALGGISLEAIHAGRGDGGGEALAFHDVAVLVRLTAQADVLAEVLTREGIPFHRAGNDGVSAPATAAEAEIEPQKIALLTLHAAKGLEFPLVFVAGCEDGLLPLGLPGLAFRDREEERRLLYVGMTRARHRLVLTSARRRRLFGRMVENRPCPFLEGLPPDLILTRAEAPRPRRARQLPLF
jgi:ATP-dependent DNA helicase UvrD/PcrA